MELQKQQSQARETLPPQGTLGDLSRGLGLEDIYGPPPECPQIIPSASQPLEGQSAGGASGPEAQGELQGPPEPHQGPSEVWNWRLPAIRVAFSLL